MAVLENPAYKKLAKDPIEATEQNAAPVISMPSFPENATEHLQPHVSRPPRLYGLPPAAWQNILWP
jgi:hypothetical protein